MEFRVLGSIEVVGADGPVPLGGPKQRAVLAHLIVRAKRVVSTEALIDAVWPDDPPEAARGTVQAYVSNLRKAVGPDRIASSSPGYSLRVDADEVDALRFERLCADARRVSTDPTRAAAILREALALWRGPPYADLNELRTLEGECRRLEELRLSALEDRVEAELDAGRHAELVGELEALVRDHPLRERFWGCLMLARYRSGRQGDALAAFHEARTTLAEELGVDPSPELQRLHERILRQDPALELSGRALRGYRLLERIGENEVAVVHRGLQPHVGREVVVKSIDPRVANDPEFVRRFEPDAQLVARLEHPRVVPLDDFWRDSDGAHLVTRFLHGGSLRRRLEGDPGMAPEDLAPVLDQISEALAAAHRLGIVHRDVRPENILFDADGNAYLADFAIGPPASIVRGSAGRRAPAHLAPEQIRGEPATPRSDVYALGALTRQALSRPQQPLPPSVRAVIDRATAADPESRFPDAPSFAVAFRAAIKGVDVETPPAVAPEISNPYRGLRPFDEADAPVFFGREALTRRLLARLAQDGTRRRFLAVVGPSGSGKSSVVNAGLLPALRGGAISGSGAWFYARATPGAHPFEELETALLRVAIDPPASLLGELQRDDRGLVATTERILPADGSELVLVIDQLEELFTATEDETVRASFLDTLTTATTDQRSRLRVIVCLRADVFDRPLLYPGFGELLGVGAAAVTPLSSEELERVISGPASRVGIDVDPALIAEVTADVSREPAALPLLQYALTEVFEHRSGDRLTLEAYRGIGGVSGAVARRADELFGELDDEGKEACREIFLRLVTLGEGEGATRRRVLRSELDSLGLRQAAVEAVLDRFGRARLLSFDRDPATRGPVVEAAHEALWRAWGRLRGWIEDARDDVRTHRRLLAAAEEWESSGRDEGALLRGSRLEDVKAWAPTAPVALGRLASEYLASSVEQLEVERAAEQLRADRERALERRSVRRLRGLVVVLAVAALVGGSLTVVATQQRNRAEQARLQTRARELAVAADAAAEVDPVLSILLALEAVDTTRHVDGTVVREAEEALHRAILASRERLVIPSTGGSVDASPDGARIVTTDSAGGAVVRDAATGDVVGRLDGAGGVTAAAYSPDGHRIVTSHEDGAVAVWDAASGDRLAASPSRSVAAMSAIYEPTGERILAIWEDGRARLLDAATLEVNGSLRAFDDEAAPDLNVAELASFSPDGSRVAIVNPCCPAADASVHVWDVSGGSPEVVDSLPGAWQHDVDFSPDGSLLATAGADVRVWNAETGALLATLAGPSANVHDVEFDESGRRLVASDIAGVVGVWQVDGPTGAVRELARLLGHAGPVHEVVFVPGADLVATAGTDGTTRLWDVSIGGGSEQLTLPGTPVWNGDVEFAENARTLVASSEVDGVVGVWDARTGERLLSLRGHDLGAGTFGIDVSPDGSMIATASGDKTVKVWDTATGRELYTFQGHAACPGGLNVCPVWDVEFSHDGTLLATAGGDGTARILDARTGMEVGSLVGHEGFVTEVDFSPDDGRLATASWDGTARIWEVRSGQLLLELAHPSDPPQVQSVDFSPDGSRVATGGWDGRVRVWDSRAGTMIASWQAGPEGSFDAVYSPDGSIIATPIALWDAETGDLRLRLTGTAARIAFSPDGSRLATTDPPPGSLIRVWVLPLEHALALAETRLTRGFTREQCRAYRIEPCR